MDLSFYNGKRVFVTGHTGFKGSWLCFALSLVGAKVTGYSLAPEKEQSLFSMLKLEDKVNSVIGDIRDKENLKKTFLQQQPEVVFHLAAQPLVLESFENPVYTYETNVLGTVNILECVRLTPSVKSFLNVTTDKVYENNEWEWGYRENDRLNGYDPYSNSKSCSELVTDSYKKSFFSDNSCAISTARAGNVIGGGDFSENRIIPDCVRFASEDKPIIIRNPQSTRPYQHVLEPIFAYLLIAKQQYQDVSFAGCYNIGPDDIDCVTTKTLVEIFCKTWGEASYQVQTDKNAPHEANFLKLDCSKIKKTFGWSPKMNVCQAVQKTVEWSKAFINSQGDVEEITKKQISEYMGETQ